jgi:hypothetical protein
MKKTEIIAESLKQVQNSESETTLWTGPESSYEEHLAVALEQKFAHVSEDVDMLTCEELADLGVKCCPVCHDEYPDEMELLELKADRRRAALRDAQPALRGSTLITSNLPFQEWTEVLGSERLTGALLDRLTHHVHILEMNGDSYRLKQSRRKRTPAAER